VEETQVCRVPSSGPVGNQKGGLLRLERRKRSHEIQSKGGPNHETLSKEAWEKKKSGVSSRRLRVLLFGIPREGKKSIQGFERARKNNAVKKGRKFSRRNLKKRHRTRGPIGGRSERFHHRERGDR